MHDFNKLHAFIFPERDSISLLKELFVISIFLSEILFLVKREMSTEESDENQALSSDVVSVVD